MGKQTPLLTISLLASNRPDTIRRCLDSLRVIREAIPCELILIDTSKSEEIHKILCEYTEFVYSFEWCNDFAKARNEGLKRAKGQWFLFLDDDEWFIDAEGIIKFFASGEYKQYGYANYIVRNYMDIHYSTYSDGYVTRMIRLEADTEFRSKIHEYLAPIRGNRKDIEALVGHSGYIYETEEKKKTHFKRNYDLLLEMLQEEPENVRWKMQMVQELSVVGNWKELVDFCGVQIEDNSVIHCSYDGVYGNPALGTFYAGGALGLYKLEQYEATLYFCQNAIENAKNTEVLRAHMCFRMAECYYKLSNWMKAEEYIKRYLDEEKRLSQHVELIREHKMVAMLGEVFDENHMQLAYHTLICIGLKRGSSNELCEYYQYLSLDQKVVTLTDEVLEALSEALVKMSVRPILIRLIQDVYRNNGLEKYFSDKFLLTLQSDEADVESLARVYAEVKICHGDVLFAKAYLNFETAERKELISAYLKKYQVKNEMDKSLENLSNEAILQIFNNYMVGVLEYYLLVCPEEWFEGEMELLPDEARGAVWLNQMFGREQSDIESKLSDLKECVKYLPWLGENIRKLAACVTEEVNVANQQLVQMVELMKGKIVFMIEQGLKKEALDVIRQVQNLAPWDEELSELERHLIQ